MKLTCWGDSFYKQSCGWFVHLVSVSGIVGVTTSINRVVDGLCILPVSAVLLGFVDGLCILSGKSVQRNSVRNNMLKMIC